ncbi:MAG TPA: hypothetical protein VL242_25540 [Sorangium sp.]|nr:hypothetical protein [Sorangium sp.]
MSDSETRWALAQTIVSRAPALPDWVRECAEIGYESMMALPLLDDADTGELARPSLELKNVP